MFPVQLRASIFGYLARDVVAGTGMGVLAATWLSLGLITLTGAPGSLSDPLGLLLLVAAAAMAIPAIGALGRKGVATVVLFTTALRFATTGVYELSGNEGWGDAASVVGLVLCVLALAAALVMLLKDARGDAAAEPGVRPQLQRPLSRRRLPAGRAVRRRRAPPG